MGSFEPKRSFVKSVVVVAAAASLLAVWSSGASAKVQQEVLVYFAGADR